MGLRRWSIRLRIFLLVAIPILSLIGLYVFTATTTASNAISLNRSRTIKNTIATPIGALVTALDAERLTAVIYLAVPLRPDLAALDAAEHKTDQAVTRVRQASLAPQLRDGSRPAAAGASARTAPDPSPEAARSTMTALQRGWERGRYISGAPVPSFDTAQSAEPGTNGDERNDM